MDKPETNPAANTPEAAPIHTFVAPGEGPRVMLNLTVAHMAFLLASHGVTVAALTAKRDSAESSAKFISMLHSARLSTMMLGADETIALGETLMSATSSLADVRAEKLDEDDFISQLEAAGFKVIKLDL